MADTVKTQVLHEDEHRYVAYFTNVSDGTGESAVVKIDVSALSPACSEVRIRKVKWATHGMSVKMLWDATADTLIMVLPESTRGELDFSKYGGLVNSAGAGKTGDVLFTTIGHAAGDAYFVLLDCEKVY